MSSWSARSAGQQLWPLQQAIQHHAQQARSGLVPGDEELVAEVADLARRECLVVPRQREDGEHVVRNVVARGEHRRPFVAARLDVVLEHRLGMGVCVHVTAAQGGHGDVAPTPELGAVIGADAEQVGDGECRERRRELLDEVAAPVGREPVDQRVRRSHAAAVPGG